MSNYSLRSPNQQLCLQIVVENGGLSYSVVKNQVTVIDSSPIGAVLSKVDMSCGIRVVSEKTGMIDEQYVLPVFKKAVCRDYCNTLAIGLEKNGYPMTLEARAYDDGAAFRMIFPEEEILKKEKVGFKVPESAISVYGMKFRFTYEEEFNRIPREELHQNLWIFPMLIEAGKGVWGLITEAAVYGEYGGSILSASKEIPGVLWTTEAPDEFEELKLPVTTPWRVVLAGSLNEIVNSNTIENLNPSCEVEDTSFIKGGMAAWSCFSDMDSSESYERQRDYIDLASEMEWPFHTVDGGWHSANMNIKSLVEYGKEKGVGIWIWAHRRMLQDPAVAEEKIALWASWGIVGLKIDFFESDSRERIRLYDMLSELCAKYRLMVNYHGAAKNTGELRRWPHVVSREGVMGGENFQNYATEYFVDATARHNCNLVFTRNAVGPMDYTPTTYETYRTGTSHAHQTALPVVFTSYITHIMERPEDIRKYPCSQFLKGLPAAWDESVLLEGAPENYATMARRKGSTWYVGGICACRSRVATVDLSFLEEGEYRATLYQDGLEDLQAVDVPIGVKEPTSPEWYPQWDTSSRPTSFAHDLKLVDISSFTVTKDRVLEIPCVQDGGFALKLEKLDTVNKQ